MKPVRTQSMKKNLGERLNLSNDSISRKITESKHENNSDIIIKKYRNQADQHRSKGSGEFRLNNSINFKCRSGRGLYIEEDGIEGRVGVVRAFWNYVF